MYNAYWNVHLRNTNEHAHRYKMYGYLSVIHMCLCPYTHTLSLYFSDRTQSELSMIIILLRSLRMWEIGRIILYFILYLFILKIFSHQPIELLLKEGSLVTFGAFFLYICLYKNFVRCYLKLNPSFTICLWWFTKKSWIYNSCMALVKLLKLCLPEIPHL